MKKIILPLIAVLLLAATSGSAYYFYDRYQDAQSKLENPDLIAQQEVQAVIDKLKKIMDLPDEEPTIATVLEKDKLQDQPFFQRAENGDKVVIFTKAAKAVLFRPSANRIIEVAPIDITQPPADESSKEVTETSPAPTRAPAPVAVDDDEEAVKTEE